MHLKINLQQLSKLNSFDNTYVYVVKFLEKDISNYLTESQEAINFYYTC